MRMITYLRIHSLIACMGTFYHLDAGELGEIPAGGFRSPEGDQRFTPQAGVKPLNNLVFELLNQKNPGTRSYQFRNPREGWIYLRVSTLDGHAIESLSLDGKPVTLNRVEGSLEAMHYTTEGEHSVKINSHVEKVKQLEVRAIGELFYTTYGNNPHIRETGDYTWEFLKQNCLDHYNSMIATENLSKDGTSIHEEEIQEWTQAGKRWFTREPVPYNINSAEDAYNVWSNSPGMQHKHMSGIWVDEFGVGEKYGKKTADLYPFWIEAIKKIRANPKFTNRNFYAYSPSRLLPSDRFEQMVPFVKTLTESGYRFGPEWYLPEAYSRPGREIIKTGDLINEFSPGWEQASRKSFEEAYPGSATKRVLVLSLLSEPGWESGDLFPGYDFNVFLDCQLQFVATDPAFFAIQGLQGYTSNYCGEEQTRLFAKLVRHYAIEGKTERFLADPFVLHHLKNADLSNGTSDWTLSPAITSNNQQSIDVKTVPGLGTLQAKYHAPKGTGDLAFWTRQSKERPNIISQPILKLTPGRLYSLRLMTGDFRELNKGESIRRKHPVSVKIENADLLPEKTFQAIVESGYWHRFGKFSPNNPYYLNLHQIVFRAKSETATLKLSDWASNEKPDGKADEELLWNYFQIQPYFE